MLFMAPPASALQITLLFGRGLSWPVADDHLDVGRPASIVNKGHASRIGPDLVLLRKFFQNLRLSTVPLFERSMSYAARRPSVFGSSKLLLSSSLAPPAAAVGGLSGEEEEIGPSRFAFPQTSRGFARFQKFVSFESRPTTCLCAQHTFHGRLVVFEPLVDKLADKVFAEILR